MHRLAHFLLPALLVIGAVAADQPTTAPSIPCVDGVPGAPACTGSSKDLKDAKLAFHHGLKLQKNHQLDQAYVEFDKAAQLVPRDLEYVTARELLRAQLVSQYLKSGNAHLTQGRNVEALGEFRAALQLDPDNQFAQQQLQAAVGPEAPPSSPAPLVIADSGEIKLAPLDQRADFHYTGNSRELLTQIAAVFGVNATFDDSVQNRNVQFDIQNVDFYRAMRAVAIVTKTFWTPLDSKQMLVLADSPENHRLFDRMGMRTFYIADISTPQELNDITNALRVLFEVRYIMQQVRTSTITMRAPWASLEAATRFLGYLSSGRPEVLLDIKTFEVSHTFTRAIGVHIPSQFKLFNIPAAALLALGGQNIQDLINQLIAGGGINQAGSTSLSALLAQLQSQQNSIFSQPIATFGGGLTLMGLSLDTLSATLSLNESSIRNLEHATIRASQSKDATFHLGSKYPILNASFAPIFNTPAISQVIQNNSFTPAFPSFNYEDLGLNLKAKPIIHSNLDVSLQLELQLRSLGTQNLNGVPVISNREYKGSITLKDGEPAVVAGSLSRSESRSLSGLPGAARVPGLNRVTSTENKQEDDDELLIVITPHVLSSPEQNAVNEIWVTGGSGTGAAGAAAFIAH
ncbi:MAG TPA: hypothetical protein VFA89_00800 [Terriglobales bacterium]|nr:hypothetical protein [Terriglobales bacterium]